MEPVPLGFRQNFGVILAEHLLYGQDAMKEKEYKYQSEWALGYFNKGFAEGFSSVILSTLRLRQISVTEHQRRQMAECTDVEKLDRWLEMAMTATCADDLFAE